MEAGVVEVKQFLLCFYYVSMEDIPTHPLGDSARTALVAFGTLSCLLLGRSRQRLRILNYNDADTLSPNNIKPFVLGHRFLSSYDSISHSS